MSNHIGPIVRVVVCAANRYHKMHIFTGARHFDDVMSANIRMASRNEEIIMESDYCEQGFIDQYGVYMDRYESFSVARDAGQIDVRRTKTAPYNMLFSEDLY